MDNDETQYNCALTVGDSNLQAGNEGSHAQLASSSDP
jgi:hypothetical protein